MKRKLLDEKMTESMPISNFRLIMSASLAGPETSALSVFDDTGVFGTHIPASSSMSRPSEAVSSPLSPGTSTSEMTPRSLKKRPGKMALQEFGGVDPFPSVGTPLSEVNRPSTLNRTVDISSPRLQASDKDGSLSVSKASGSGLLRPQLTLELDKSTSGVDPMPSLEARRAPGADPVPWDDELFDPTADGDYMDFDEEDMARQSASSPIQEEQGEDDEDDGPEPGVDIAAVEQALQAL